MNTRTPYYMHSVDCTAHASDTAPCTKDCDRRRAAADGRAHATHTVTVTDHRPGAYGDWSIHRVDSYRAALALMAEYHCGIAFVETKSAEWTVEYDGKRFTTFGHYHKAGYPA